MPRCIRASGTAIVALALAIAPVSAQTVLGLHIGTSIATLGGSDAGNPSSHAGLSVGASLTFPLAHVLGIQVGADYVQKGAKDSSTGTEVTLANNYIQVPVLLRVGIPSAGLFGAHILVGPDVSFQTGCTAKGSGGGVNVSVDCSQFGLDLKTVDFGAMGGVGFDFGLPGSGLTITVEGLYNLGLSSIIKSGGNIGNLDVKNRVFTVRAGVGLPLG